MVGPGVIRGTSTDGRILPHLPLSRRREADNFKALKRVVLGKRRFALLHPDFGHALQPGQRLRSGDRAAVSIVVVEPGEAGFGVLTRRRRVRERVFSGDRQPLYGVGDGDEAAAGVPLVPRVQAVVSPRLTVPPNT